MPIDPFCTKGAICFKLNYAVVPQGSRKNPSCCFTLVTDYFSDRIYIFPFFFSFFFFFFFFCGGGMLIWGYSGSIPNLFYFFLQVNSLTCVLYHEIPLFAQKQRYVRAISPLKCVG